MPDVKPQEQTISQFANLKPTAENMKKALKVSGIDPEKWKEAEKKDRELDPNSKSPSEHRDKLISQVAQNNFMNKWSASKTYQALGTGGFVAARKLWRENTRAECILRNNVLLDYPDLLAKHRVIKAQAAARQQADANAANVNNPTPKNGNSMGARLSSAFRYAVSSPPKLPLNDPNGFARRLERSGLRPGAVVVLKSPDGGYILRGVDSKGKLLSNNKHDIRVHPNGSVSCSPDLIKSANTDAKRDNVAKMMLAAHTAGRNKDDKSPITVRCKDPLMMAAMHRQLVAQGYMPTPSQQALKEQQQRIQKQQQVANTVNELRRESNNANRNSPHP